MTAERRAVQVVISGRVQGVGYRAWTVEQAGLRELAGWVRNQPDGTVEAVFAGDALDVDAMLDSCWKGPAGALVTDIKVAETEEPGLTGFSQR
ncbi:acylphosphatase [Indioceanicola profundi]|uniref:acylphosphatase n=1 Tax=Indioceanicola profundi TaxID=2220096 RepID=UPI000E6AA1F9|nr:acylphosphatase [Indioceanicola profundi]